MGTQNSGPSMDLAGLAAANGLSLGMAGGWSGDTADRQLLWDREQQTPFGREEAGQASGGWKGRGSTKEVVFTESKATHHIYNRPDKAGVEELQRRLWAGGFYPPSTQLEDITPGLPDPLTAKAWENLLDRSANYYAAGKRMTVWEVLDEGAAILGPDGAGGAGGRGSGGRAPLVTELTNPEDLKYVAQRTAVGTLGRALRPDELNRFISSFHGSQQSAQAQAYNQAGGAGGSVVSAPNPQAAAESFARQADPTAAGAHDFVKVFDSFSKMLGGTRGRG